ncbi:MAG: hypothetical protein ACOX3U_00885 [Christensenellales bacterium]|jgi:hypothetical protein
MKDTLVAVKSDALDIVRRIREIDKGYFTVYNLTKSRYEVHHVNNPGNTLAVVIPYKKLDKRAVDYVLKTRIERIKQIETEIELNNRRIELDYQKKLIDRLMI